MDRYQEYPWAIVFLYINTNLLTYRLVIHGMKFALIRETFYMRVFSQYSRFEMKGD